MMMNGSAATDAQARARVPRAARAERGDEPLVEHRPHHQAVVANRPPHETDVDRSRATSALDLVRRRHVAQLQQHAGIGAAESEQHLGQEAEDAGDAEPDAQRAGFAPRRALGERDDLRRNPAASCRPRPASRRPASVSRTSR